MREFVILESLPGFVKRSHFQGCDKWKLLDDFRLKEVDKDGEPNNRTSRCIPRRFSVKLRYYRLVRNLNRVEKRALFGSKKRMEFKPGMGTVFEIEAKADFDGGIITAFSLSEGVQGSFCGADLTIMVVPHDVV